MVWLPDGEKSLMMFGRFNTIPACEKNNNATSTVTAITGNGARRKEITAAEGLCVFGWSGGAPILFGSDGASRFRLASARGTGFGG